VVKYSGVPYCLSNPVITRTIRFSSRGMFSNKGASIALLRASIRTPLPIKEFIGKLESKRGEVVKCPGPSIWVPTCMLEDRVKLL